MAVNAGSGAATPAAVFSNLPDSVVRASGRIVTCASTEQTTLGGSRGVALRLGFSAVTYGAHYDGNDNWLAELAGTRRLLLLHPKEGALLRPQTNRSHPEYRQAELGFLREINAQRDGQAKAARGLAAILGTGDALHIPAGWMHYVEVEPPDTASKGFWLSMARFCETDATIQSRAYGGCE